MFVELIDQLRCPGPHEDSWLVLFADESRDRHILRGTLGCPICGRRYVIERGTAWFTEAGGDATAAVATGSLPERPASPPSPERGPPTGVPPTAVSPSAVSPTALAAYLGLAEPGGVAGLFGSWARIAGDLGDVVEMIELVAIAPDTPTDPMQSAIMPRSRAQVPLATGSLRAAAVDQGDDAGLVATEAARLVRSGGRILAPASVPVPDGVRELTRDDSWWIGEREGGMTSGFIPITGRPSGA